MYLPLIYLVDIFAVAGIHYRNLARFPTCLGHILVLVAGTLLELNRPGTISHLVGYNDNHPWSHR